MHEVDTGDQISSEPILKVATGFMAAKHLFVASEIGLFAALADGPLTLDEIAQRTGVPRPSIRILAGAMEALGFVSREGDRFRNDRVAQAFLTDGPTSLRPGLRFFDRISYRTWARFEKAIRTRRGVRGELSPGQNEIRSQGIEALTAGAARALAEAHDFSGYRRILDLGGGMGFFLRVLVEHYPTLSATLFEAPGVAAIARQRLAETPEGGRIDIVEGDFFQDPIPSGYDAVLLSSVIHLFSPEHNRELLTRIRAAARPGAVLLLVDFWTDASHTEPLFAALLAGEWLTATGEADCYSVEEVNVWLHETGWTVEAHRSLAGPAGLIAARAAE